MTGFEVEDTDEKIDMEKLKRKEKILFYHDLTLFEDELHDNGVASFSVKIVNIYIHFIYKTNPSFIVCRLIIVFFCCSTACYAWKFIYSFTLFSENRQCYAEN